MLDVLYDCGERNTVFRKSLGQGRLSKSKARRVDATGAGKPEHNEHDQHQVLAIELSHLSVSWRRTRAACTKHSQVAP